MSQNRSAKFILINGSDFYAIQKMEGIRGKPSVLRMNGQEGNRAMRNNRFRVQRWVFGRVIRIVIYFSIILIIDILMFLFRARKTYNITLSSKRAQEDSHQGTIVSEQESYQ